MIRYCNISDSVNVHCIIYICPLTVITIYFTTPQVTHFGCKSFALLFDDIDHNMCPADKEVFSSFAQAQVSITNEIYQYLGEPETFLFCPTGTCEVHQNHLHVFTAVLCNHNFCCSNPEYCGTLCYPNVAQSPYLRTVGEKLLPGIDVLWTGEFKITSTSRPF